MSCHYLHDCKTGSMICRTGECVSNKYKCDGEWDCQKGEDERFCSQIIPGEEDETPAERKMVDTEDDYTPAQSVFISKSLKNPENRFHAISLKYPVFQRKCNF